MLMSKKLFCLCALFCALILSAGTLPEKISFEKNTWTAHWSVAPQAAASIQNTPQGIKSKLPAGKKIRLTGKKLLEVKKGDVVQARVYFEGKKIFCGFLGYNAQKKFVTAFYPAATLPADLKQGNGSVYYTVPANVKFVRLYTDLTADMTLQKIHYGIINAEQQKSYFYNQDKNSILMTFHSGQGRELPRNCTNMWKSGTMEVLDEKFSDFTKIIKITADKKNAGVYFSIPFKVKKGDCIMLQTVFKGSGSARVGVFGSGYFKAKVIPTVNRQWDRRQEIFEITSDKCKNLYGFVAAHKGHTIRYAYIKLTRLINDPRTTFLPERLAQKWRTLTSGKNLAKGKKVIAFPGNKKKTSFLTDGSISTMTNLVFHTGALEWHNAMRNKHIRLIVDLGKVQKVGKAGIRISGGKRIMLFPRQLKIFVSKDGKKYYPAASLAKVTPAEADLTDWQNLYFLHDKDPNGVTFTYPFVLNVNADARYVAFSVESDSYYTLITDELAVIEAAGKKSEDWNTAYKKSPDAHFNHQAVKITPYLDKFYIAEDIYLPNRFNFDIRLDQDKEKFTYTIDLPSQVEFVPCNDVWPQKSMNHVKTQKAAARNVYHFAPNYTVGRMRRFSVMYYNGPFLFRVPKGVVIPEKERYAVITAVSSGGKISMRYPLEVLKFNRIKPYKRLKFGQMNAARFMPSWPDYARSWKTVGYNMLQFEVSPNQISPAFGKKVIAATDQAGLFRRAFSNPICDMCYSLRRDKAELRCTSAVAPGKKWIGQLDFCPSYRGVYYKELLENIRKMVVNFKPHVIEFDDEAWNPTQLNFIFDCTRCQALRKKKGMDWKTFIEWAQADFLKGYYEAVKKGAAEAGIPMPDVTHWPFSPVSGNYTARGIKIMNHGFPYLFPKYANLATHFYYAQSVADQQKGIREALETVKDPKKLAMTVHGGIGCYRTGYMGKKTTHLFMDSVLNGTTHVLQYGSFTSPHDFYQMNIAIGLLVPHEDILMDGALDLAFTGSNKKLLYTKRTLGKRSLLLIGNYSGSRAVETVLAIRGKVKDCVTGKTFTAKGSCKIKIAADDFAMLLVEE